MQFGMHLKTLGCSESKLDPIEYQYGVPNKLAGEYIPSHMQCVVYVEITVKSYLCILIISLLQTPVKAPYWLTEDDGGKKKKSYHILKFKIRNTLFEFANSDSKTQL